MTLSRRTQLIVALCLLFLLVDWVYLRARAHTMAAIQQDIDATIQARQDLAAIVPELEAETDKPAPDPTPDLSGWLNNNGLTGLERRIVSNQRASNGQGATLHIRDLPPRELSEFFSRLTAVNIQIKQFQLDDFSGSGKWDMTITLAAPGKTK